MSRDGSRKGTSSSQRSLTELWAEKTVSLPLLPACGRAGKTPLFLWLSFHLHLCPFFKSEIWYNSWEPHRYTLPFYWIVCWAQRHTYQCTSVTEAKVLSIKMAGLTWNAVTSTEFLYIHERREGSGPLLTAIFTFVIQMTNNTKPRDQGFTCY